MSRKDDLESAIQESYELIREYEAIIRTSDRPEEIYDCNTYDEPVARYRKRPLPRRAINGDKGG